MRAFVHSNIELLVTMGAYDLTSLQDLRAAAQPMSRIGVVFVRLVIELNATSDFAFSRKHWGLSTIVDCRNSCTIQARFLMCAFSEAKTYDASNPNQLSQQKTPAKPSI